MNELWEYIMNMPMEYAVLGLIAWMIWILITVGGAYSIRDAGWLVYQLFGTIGKLPILSAYLDRRRQRKFEERKTLMANRLGQNRRFGR